MYHTPAVSVSILKSISFLIFVGINAFDGPRHPVSYDDIIIELSFLFVDGCFANLQLHP